MHLVLWGLGNEIGVGGRRIIFFKKFRAVLGYIFLYLFQIFFSL